MATGQCVTFVSLTNDDAGHHLLGGLPLAWRRYAETRTVAEHWDLEYTVLDIHDGELEPNLRTRWTVMEVIRRAAPDLLHRLNDYHPDHRACAQLVLDARRLPDLRRELSEPLPQRPAIA